MVWVCVCSFFLFVFAQKLNVSIALLQLCYKIFMYAPFAVSSFVTTCWYSHVEKSTATRFNMQNLGETACSDKTCSLYKADVIADYVMWIFSDKG
jgi:hypothetical protein